MIRVDESDPVGEVAPPFPYKDVVIKRNTDVKEHYEMLSEIGRGKFGTVYQCREKSTGLELAAKLVVVNRRDERRTVEREVEIMRKLRHPRLIQLYDAYDSGKLMCVVLELIQGGELFERVIDDDFILTEKACTVFMRQICEGIEFVHQQNILHLDLKPENILCLTKTGNRIKIIDFGLARFFDPDKNLQVLFGTPEFVAPEVVNFDQIGYGTDMWSVGVICYVLLSGLSPFMGETDVETMANVTIAKYDFDDEAFNEISDDAKDFISKLLVKDKQARLTASECIRHKWLVRRDTPPKKPEAISIHEAPRLPPVRSKTELDVTKDNLRMFVERWSEHPNSPYVFDISTHEISQCFSSGNIPNDQRSEHSLGGCSPSPRSSLNSSPDSVLELEFEPLPRERLVPRYNPVERRASDSSCFIHKKTDVCMRVNLAEEIKKLSDRLYMLSTMNTDLQNNNICNETNKNSAKRESKTSSGTKETKIMNGGTNGYSLRTTKTTTSMTNGFNTNGVERKVVSSKSSHRVNSKFLNDREPEVPVTSNMPWVKSPRSKFRITNLSRDVPDQPSDRRKSFFGADFDKQREQLFKNSSDVRRQPYKRDDGETNAHRTKDLLLHLLERWGEDDEDRSVSGHSTMPGRHQSVSIEWSDADRVAQRSLSSLNAFFQRQTSDEHKKRDQLAAK